MSRAIAAALVLAATALLAPASAIAQAAPNPDPLWSEFPLEPLIADRADVVRRRLLQSSNPCEKIPP